MNQLNLNAIAGIEDLSDEVAATQSGGRKFIKLWEDFTGSGQGFWQRDMKKNQIYNLNKLNDKLSSIEISGEAPDGLKVTLYEDKGGRGRSWTLGDQRSGYDFRVKSGTEDFGGVSPVTGTKTIGFQKTRDFYETNVPNDKISSFKLSW